MDHGAKLEARDQAGSLPLHDAALGGNPDVLRALLRRRADLAAVTPDTRQTALHLAASWGRYEAVRVLVEAGADRNARDAFRDSPYYDYTEEFCAKYDQTAFDPHYASAPLSHYEPLIRQYLVPKEFAENYNALT